MSEELEMIIGFAKISTKVHGEPSEQYVGIGIFEELIYARKAEPISMNGHQVDGKYVHKARYEGILFISTSDEELEML